MRLTVNRCSRAKPSGSERGTESSDPDYAILDEIKVTGGIVWPALAVTHRVRPAREVPEAHGPEHVGRILGRTYARIEQELTMALITKKSIIPDEQVDQPATMVPPGEWCPSP